MHPKLSPRQQACLDVLASHWTGRPGEWCLYVRYIAERAELGERETRLAVRALQRKGLVQLVRGLIDEDTGLLAGSGWEITKAGMEWADDTD